MKITKAEIEEGRKMYQEFLKGMSGGFYTSLFETIARSKNENTYKMSKAFPGEVYAYLEYTGMLYRVSWDIEGETFQEKMKREYPHLAEK